MKELVAAAFAVISFWIFTLVMAWIIGANSQAQLALQAYETAEYSVRQLEVCVQTSARAMSLVLHEDVYLHQQIRELPPLVWVDR